nr:hypothetical protein [Tanacetum cinerariifolium]
LNEKAAKFNNDTFTNPFALPNTNSAESSLRIVDTSNMHTFQQPLIYTKRWTKDHPLVTIISDPSKPVSIRRQLSTDALWCNFHAFLAKEERKNYKEAMEESCWIEAMQEEIHEFERLEVWELVPRPDRAMIIRLKWIFKVKLDKYCDGCKDSIFEWHSEGRGSKLDEDPNETPVDPTRYRGMVGSLMYLTASRPDLVFSICICADTRTLVLI